MNWSESEIETLKSLWSNGLSARVIGKGLGRERNAILGKVHRLGLEGRKVEERTIPRPWVPGKRKPSPPPLPALKPKPETKDGRKRGGTSYSVLASARARQKPIEPLPEPRGPKIGIVELSYRDCRYPHGDPREKAFHFCARPVEQDGSPYCNFHRSVCYEPLRSLRS